MTQVKSSKHIYEKLQKECMQSKIIITLSLILHSLPRYIDTGKKHVTEYILSAENNLLRHFIEAGQYYAHIFCNYMCRVSLTALTQE